MEGTEMKIPRAGATVPRSFLRTGKRRGYMRTVSGKKKDFYFSYIAKILKQVHQDFSGYSWVLDALWSLDYYLFEQATLEAVRLSFYNHRRVVTSREMLEALNKVPLEGWM
ncbi:histone H2A.N isoform X2 [Monodelphis domestica]|uniref:histone H2A.N isoform X2 n=1 Tax=Monodelphis domestica TaxID=13616 RepID=UPI0004432861|nr:histone H2A.N isoform X2 [Monodelphis domestica]